MTTEHSLMLLVDLLCVLMCLCAAIIDIRSMRIPNVLTYSGAIVGLALNFGIVWTLRGLHEGITAGLFPSSVGCLLLLGCFIALAAIGPMGGGDVKLMAAVGAFLRWPLCLYAVAYVLIMGGVVSLAYALARGQLRHVLSNIFTGGKTLLHRGPSNAPLELHRIPYGTAILMGVTWAVLARYFAVLRFP
jgi:prepilin peptidase CpaA